MHPSFNFHGSIRHPNLPNQRKNESKSRSKGRAQGDRVISLAVNQQQQINFQSAANTSQNQYQQLLLTSMKSNLGGSGQKSSQERVLQFKNQQQSNQQDELQKQMMFHSQPFVNMPNITDMVKHTNFIPQPLLSLDAPEIEDSFTITPIDWSNHNYIALACPNSLYTYNYSRKQVVQLNTYTVDQGEFTCVRWSRQLPDMLASGNRQGQVELWDIDNQQLIQTIKVARSQRTVNCLTISENIIASGCENSIISIYDPRRGSSVAQLSGHLSSVLGVKFQNDGFGHGPYLASSGADKIVLVWDLRKRESVLFQLAGHSASVKALDWSPYKAHLLCTGGGDGDHTINLWLANLGQHLMSFKTKSETTSIVYSNPKSQHQELFTGHGGNDNALRVWNATVDYRQEQEIHEHKKRILGMALNPEGKLLCSLGADELMKIWRVEEENTPHDKPSTKLSRSVDSYR